MKNRYLNATENVRLRYFERRGWLCAKKRKRERDDTREFYCIFGFDVKKNTHTQEALKERATCVAKIALSGVAKKKSMRPELTKEFQF